MRFERLELAAFGRFTGHAIDFGDGSPDFHLLFGLNEAGKTTTLAAVTDLLFGIEERTPYNFRHDYRAMLLAATVADAKGDRLSFQRRKGRSNTLLDADGNVLEEAKLAALLGQVDRPFFSGMFGLDHAALRQGGQHILSAEGDLGQSLFQAGAAVRDLHALLGRLDAESGSLFAPQAQKPRINAALAEFRAVRGRIGELGLKGDTWSREQAEQARLTARIAAIADERAGLVSRRSQVERIRRVLPLLARHQALSGEADSLADAPRLPDDAPAQRRAALTSRQECRRARGEAESLSSRLKERLAGLAVDQAVLAVADAVDRLRKQHGAVAKTLEDLPRRLGEQAEMQEQIAGILRDLGRATVPVADARVLLPSRPAVALIRSLITEAARVETEHRRTAEAAEDARELATRLADDMESLPEAMDPQPLADCLAEVTRHGRLDDLLAAARAERQRHEESLAARLAALAGWVGDAGALARLPVPDETAVLESEDRWRRAAARREEADTKLGAVHEEERQREAELAGLMAAGPVATEAAVQTARQLRDEGWRLVRRRFIEGQTVEEAPYTGGRPLADCYESAVAEADALADRVKGEARRAAQYAESVKQRTLAERRRQACEAEAAAARDNLTAEEAAWQALWHDSAVVPDRPRAMLGWLAARREILGSADQAAAARQTAAGLEQQVAAGCRSLTAALTRVGEDGSGLGFAALVARAETATRRLDQRVTDRRTLKDRLAGAKEDAAVARRRLEAAGRAAADWRRRWALALSPLDMAADSGTVVVEEVLGVLDHLAALLPKAEDLGHRIATMKEDVASFGQAVAALATAATPDLIGREPLDALSAMASRAQAARDADRAAGELGRQIEEAEASRSAAERGLAAAEENLARLCRQAGCAQPEDLEEAERRAARRQAVEQEKAGLEREILEAGDGLGLAAIAEEVQTMDRDQILSTLDAVNAGLEALGEETDRLRGELARHETALAAMDGADTAAAAAEDAERLLAAIRDDAERYIRLRLGQAVLRQAVERYRQRHQGPLMARAAELFRRLTLDAFSGLDTGFDDRDQPILLAVRSSGVKVEVAGLSEGTRDQLFLALRLAAVDLHLAAGRRLPFLADDLLIHFDDERSTAGLAVLAELATRTQVLFFTHNRHMVDLARKHLPAGAYRVTTL